MKKILLTIIVLLITYISISPSVYAVVSPLSKAETADYIFYYPSNFTYDPNGGNYISPTNFILNTISAQSSITTNTNCNHIISSAGNTVLSVISVTSNGFSGCQFKAEITPSGSTNILILQSRFFYKNGTQYSSVATYDKVATSADEAQSLTNAVSAFSMRSVPTITAIISATPTTNSKPVATTTPNPTRVPQISITSTPSEIVSPTIESTITNQATISSTPSNSITEKSKSNDFPWAILISAIVLVGLISGGVIYYYFFFKKKNEKKNDDDIKDL